MTSRIALIAVITTALTAGGLMAKEDTSVQHRQAMRGHFGEHMAAALNLTDQQKQEAKAIFKSERETSRTVRQKLRQDRKAVEAAIQAGKPAAEVQQLAKSEGPALGNLAGMRAVAFAKFYAELTPAQQQKLVSMRQEHRQQRETAAPGHVNAETK